MGRDPGAAGFPHSGRQGVLGKGAPLLSGFPAVFREPRGAFAARVGAVMLAFTLSSRSSLCLSSSERSMFLSEHAQPVALPASPAAPPPPPPLQPFAPSFH